MLNLKRAGLCLLLFISSEPCLSGEDTSFDINITNPNINTTPFAIGDQFLEFAKNGGSSDMIVDGTTPVTFSIGTHATMTKNVSFIRCFAGTTGAIKYGQFLKMPTKLTNGIEIKIKSDDKVFTFPLIKATEDFLTKFSFGAPLNWIYTVTAAQERIRADFTPKQPFPLKKTGTYSPDDYITAKVQDNLTSGGGAADDLECFAYGFLSD